MKGVAAGPLVGLVIAGTSWALRPAVRDQPGEAQLVPSTSS